MFRVQLFAFFSYGVVIAFSVLLANFLRRWFSRCDPLGDVPGPFFARWTPFWLAFHARFGRRYLAVAEAHEVRLRELFPFWSSFV